MNKEQNTENKDLTATFGNTILLGEVITAERIVTNILNMYNLKAIEDEIILKNELAKEILKDLKNAGYLKNVNNIKAGDKNK